MNDVWKWWGLAGLGALLACGPAELPEPETDAGVDDAGTTHDAGLPVVDAGLDAGVVDAGFVPPDAGADAGFDAGLPCSGELLDNPSFECGLRGWMVLEGASGLDAGGAYQGTRLLTLTADAQGRARVSSLPIASSDHERTLTVSLRVKGTVPTARLEAFVTPTNLVTSFATPVSTTWNALPPSGLSFTVPREGTVMITVKAIGGSAGDFLQVDDFVLK